MNRNCLYEFKIVFVLACVLTLSVGCEERAKVGPETVPDANEPKAVLAEPKPAPIQPKPAATQPKPVATRPKPVAATSLPAPSVQKQPTKVTAVADVNQVGPRIKFEETVHDFGRIAPTSKNLCEFKFSNVGDALLKITKVSRTCGCTPFTLTKKEYAPGESGTLKVRYYAASQPGPVTKRLTVYSNDKTQPSVALTIKASIVLKVDYEPKRLSLVLNKENGGCPEITLTSIDGKAFSIKEFKSTGGLITAEYDSSVEATKFVLKPEINEEKLEDSSSGVIEINLTHPECKTVSISFSTVPRFRVNPPTIIVWDAEPNKPVVRKMWIISNYEEKFEVESVTSKKNILKVLSKQEVKNGYEFELEITPPSLDGAARVFMDTFSVNTKDGKKVDITCRGFYPPKKAGQKTTQE